MRRFRLFSEQGYVSLDFVRNHGLFVGKGPGFERERALLRALGPEALARRAEPFGPQLLQATELALEGLERPLQAELDSFLTCVAERREPEVGGRDGRAALALAERIESAIRAQVW
jgi:predicted dehydrogenase